MNVFGYISPRQIIICTKLKNKNQFHKTRQFFKYKLKGIYQCIVTSVIKTSTF